MLLVFIVLMVYFIIYSFHVQTFKSLFYIIYTMVLKVVSVKKDARYLAKENDVCISSIVSSFEM